QQRMAKEKPLVRRGTASASAPPGGRFNFLRLIALMFASAAILANSACAPRLAASGLEQREPAIETLDGQMRYVTRDGLALGLNAWPAMDEKAVVVALHGMADYAHAFALPAPWFAEHGFTVYAYDQRGFGRSPNRGLWAGEDALRRDLSDFVD